MSRIQMVEHIYLLYFFTRWFLWGLLYEYFLFSSLFLPSLHWEWPDSLGGDAFSLLGDSLYSCPLYIEYGLVPQAKTPTTCWVIHGFLPWIWIFMLTFPWVDKGSLLKARKVTLQRLFLAWQWLHMLSHFFLKSGIDAFSPFQLDSDSMYWFPFFEKWLWSLKSQSIFLFL